LVTLAGRQQKQTITFRSAAEMLGVFGLQQGGSQYHPLIAPSRKKDPVPSSQAFARRPNLISVA